MTTCGHVQAPVVTTDTSAPDPVTGCTTTTTTTTTTTNYTAHQGTYNSNGVARTAPASTNAVSNTSAQNCPAGRAIPLYYSPGNNPCDAGPTVPGQTQTGTAYLTESDSGLVTVHAVLTQQDPGSAEYFNVRCAVGDGNPPTVDSNGNVTVDWTFQDTYGGQPIQIDGASASDQPDTTFASAPFTLQ
jgi:hypothetical protein